MNNCVIIASHERYKITKKFIDSLSNANLKSKICRYLLILDTSKNKINQLFKENRYSFKLLYFYLGPNFWWCSAMRFGITWYLNHENEESRIIMANDDFLINETALMEFSINQKKAQKNDILVGAVGSKSSKSNEILSGIRIVENHLFKPKFKLVTPEDISNFKNKRNKLTFNANWLSISSSLYKKLGGLYNYSHAFGDYELGLKASAFGANIYYGSEQFVGQSLILSKNDKSLIKKHKQLKLGRNVPFEYIIFIKRNFNKWYLFFHLIRKLISL